MPMPAISFNDVMLSGAYAPPLQYEYKLVPKASPITWTWDPKGDPTMPHLEVEVVKVPKGRPFIARGNHSPMQNVPVRLGCTMEMVSVLAGEHWTDHPTTAHPALTQIMIGINDRLPDLPRQDMLALVPRLVDTGAIRSWGPELDQAIRQFYSQFDMANPGNPYDIQRLLDHAHHTLDLFDRQLGRPKQELDQQVLTRLMLALAA